MDALVYRSGKIVEARGFDCLADPVYVMLLNDAYEFKDDQAARSEVSKFEITGLGYTAGGRPISGRTFAWRGSVLQVKADDVSWPRSSLRARYGVMYRARGGDPSKDELMCCFDFGENVASMNGPFIIEWPGGVMRES